MFFRFSFFWLYWFIVRKASLDELKCDSFLHLYCQHCKEKHLDEIWKKYLDKLPKEKSITNLFYNWNQPGRNHIDIDNLGCLVSYNPGKVVNNKMKKLFLLICCTDIYLTCLSFVSLTLHVKYS